MTRLHIDIETYSGTDLKTAGVYRYAEDPDFRILMAAWSLDGSPVQVETTEAGINNIPGLWDSRVLKVAHNAAFERICFSRFAGADYLPPEDWHDTMAVAGEKGYPQGLDDLGKALGIAQKDSAGTALIKFFCMPNRQGRRNLPEDHPEKWAEFVEYCRQDVQVLIEAGKALGDFPTEMERRVYIADQRINDNGLPIDSAVARAAVRVGQKNTASQKGRIIELTRGDVLNPGSVQQMTSWLEGRGLTVPNLQAATVEKLLERELEPDVREVLELRQDLALAAPKKFATALDTMSRGDRIRGAFRFFGAHTGRWTGRGLQPQNLPRASLADDFETEDAIHRLVHEHEADAHTLKALVRPLFVGPFTVVDYSAIEARVVAWLAGEKWALEAFRAGRDIYVETAERMGGLTRAQGKVAVLALGYGGGTTSLEVMGGLAAYHKPGATEELTDRQKKLILQPAVDAWREANPAIVGFWRKLENAFWKGGTAGRITVYAPERGVRMLELPSGRAITYRGVYRKQDEEGRWRLFFRDPRTKGYPIDTYGGRLTENVTQAVARDIMAEALVRLDEAGFRVAGHVHDEIIVEAVDLHEVKRIMVQPPTWARGLPIDGDGFVSDRYRKG